MEKLLSSPMLSHADLEGWTDFYDLYSHIAFNHTKDGDVLVEVGVYHGKSVAFLIEQLQLAEKLCKVYAVDVWASAKQWNKFQENMFSLGINHLVKPIRCLSDMAALQFKDESCRFVYIDADHRYMAVKKDILAWLPKVKSGGILAGHDYGRPQCQGVAQAVNEIFGKNNYGVWGSSWIYHKQ